MVAAAIVKIEKHDNTVAVLPISMKFGTVTHFGSFHPVDCYNSEFVKIRDGKWWPS